MYELRYRGELLGFHETERAAADHAREHHGLDRNPNSKRPDHHLEDPENLTIEPRRPVSLFCRGNLVDTFHTAEGAAAARDKLAHPEKRPLDAWAIVDASEPAHAAAAPAHGS